MKKQLLLFVAVFFLVTNSHSQCLLPSQIFVTDVTGSSAKFNWMPDGGNTNNHEILVIQSTTTPPAPGANPIIGNGTLLFTSSTYGGFTIPSGSLVPQKKHYCYVRNVCSTTKSAWNVTPIIFTTLNCDEADKCNYKFLLSSSANSWNMASVQVKQNGTIVATLGASGINNPNGISVALCNNVPVELYWSAGGTLPNSIALTMISPFSEIIYEKPAGSGTPGTTLYNETANCTTPPACKKPSQVNASLITPNSAQINWTENNTPLASLYDLYAVPAGVAAPANDLTTSPYLISDVTNPYTLTSINGQPLSKSTSYWVYVRSKCAANAKSEWSYNPVWFTTAITNDECNTAYPVVVNAGQTCVASMTHGVTKGATQSLPTPPSNSGGCGTVDDDIWFSFTATQTAHTISFKNVVASPSTIKINHTLLSGDCSSMAQLYCSTAYASLATNLTIGLTYYIRVYTPGTNLSQFVEFDVCVTSPPANDECTDAITLQANPTLEEIAKVTASVFGATASAETTISGPGCGTTEDDVWFTFTATSPTHIINLTNLEGSTLDLNHSLYIGNCNNPALLYCSNPSLSVATNLIVGSQYKIRVYSAANNVSQTMDPFEISITTPPTIENDECSTALTLPVGNLTESSATTGYLTGATASAQSSTCTGAETDDVWYRFTAPGSALISVNQTIGTSGLNYSIYSGSDCGEINFIACLNNASDPINFTAGQNYFLRIWSTTPTVNHSAFEITIVKTAVPLSVSSALTAAQLVSNVLIDDQCVTISNVTSSTGTNFGSVNGIGYFSSSDSASFPISSGIVLSTGSLTNVPGPNLSISSSGDLTWPGDEDLNTIIQAATGQAMEPKNASKLEFDFTTVNASMSFNFLFASEEYGSFQCTFSDAFAFLLTNLNTNVTTNLAVVPNTDIPISAVTIRDNQFNSTCTSQNPLFFGNFYDPDPDFDPSVFVSEYATAANFNGITKLMTASSAVIPGVPYHIKLVVADRQDAQYDSAVFIQGGSFTSGPPECSDKIKLVSFVDTNANGTKEDGELSFTYGSFVYQLNDAPEINNISSPIGNYTIYDANPANSYDFSFVVNPEYQTYFAATATNFNNITIPVGSGTTTLYFPVTLVQAYNDVTVTIVPVSPPVAGMIFKNKIVYKNLGVAPASGTINFTKDVASTIVSTSIPVTTIPGGFIYNFTNLAPFEMRSIEVLMSIPPIPAVNIDDVLSNNITISAPANDINSTNNAFVNTQIVVASYDPNDKMEAHGEKIQFSSFNQNDYLTYTIRFQNTGTSNAINIRLEDMLDAQFDEGSIRMIDASHNYVMNRVGNSVTWYFDYIQLPGMIVNEALSHGYVTFQIKLKPGFAIGDVVPNNAAIYFDTNPPITTNTFNVEFVTQLGTPMFETSNIVIYPNPASGNIQISTSDTRETIDSIVFYDMLGKCVKRSNATGINTSLSISDLAAGIYMVEITTNTKLKAIKKLVIN